MGEGYGVRNQDELGKRCGSEWQWVGWRMGEAEMERWTMNLFKKDGGVIV